MFNQEQRLEQINKIILDIAGGNLSSRVDLSSSFDEIDAIASGINMLGEELEATMIDRNYFDSVLKSIGDILIIFDHQFSIVQVNSKTLDILQYSEQELLGKNISFVFAEPAYANEFRDILEQQDQVYNRESNFVLSSKEVMPVAVSVSKISTANQSTKGYVLLAKDLKQFYVFSDALKKKNKELETFVYKVSHDLKGPVASLLGLLELASGGQPEEKDMYLDLMKQSLTKLDRSIVALLNFTLANKTDLVVQDVVLKDHFEQVLSSLSAFPGREQVFIRNLIPKGLCISSVPDLLNSIVQNFLENAIKYRNPAAECEVLINAHQQKNEILISIKDNGLGMPPHIRDRAFDMYFRGDTAAPGSGLGLFITKNNVEKLGGSVNLQSQKGVGTEVILIIPNLSRSKEVSV